MAICIYAGTFDPPHLGHFEVAQWLNNNSAIKELWVVCGSFNPYKPFQSSPESRQKMAEMTFKDLKKVRITNEDSDSLTKRLYNENRGTEICKAVGSDVIKIGLSNGKDKIPTKDTDKYILFLREEDAELPEKITVWRGKQVTWVKTVGQQISSTKIREAVKNDSSDLNRILNPEVAAFVRDNQLYLADAVDKELGDVAVSVKKTIGTAFGKCIKLYDGRIVPFKCIPQGFSDQRSVYKMAINDKDSKVVCHVMVFFGDKKTFNCESAQAANTGNILFKKETRDFELIGINK